MLILRLCWRVCNLFNKHEFECDYEKIQTFAKQEREHGGMEINYEVIRLTGRDNREKM